MPKRSKKRYTHFGKTHKHILMPRPNGCFLTVKPLRYVEEAGYGVFPTNPTILWVGVVRSIFQSLDASAEDLKSRVEGLLEAYAKGRVTNQNFDRSVRQLLLNQPHTEAYHSLTPTRYTVPSESSHTQTGA